MNSVPRRSSGEGVSHISWGFTEDFVEPHEHLVIARQTSVEMGVSAPSTGTLALLRFLAAAVQARNVVEIGTGTGATGLALFQGMATNGVLTSIDPEVDRQERAREIFAKAELGSQRFRLIAGIPLEVLSNLRDGAYDLVFVNGDKLEYVEYVDQALRLLRHGGMIVLNDVLWHNKVADSANDEDETVIIREALESLRGSDSFHQVLLPVGNGVAAGIKR